MATTRVLLDSMIFDRIMDAATLFEKLLVAVRQGVVAFVVPHITRDQLSATKDDAKRRDLLAVYDALPKRAVATHGLVLGISRLNEARLGDGSETSGVSLDEAKTRGRGAMADALLVTTASGEADVLVTEDLAVRRAVERVKAACAVWDFEAFRQFIEEG